MQKNLLRFTIVLALLAAGIYYATPLTVLSAPLRLIDIPFQILGTEMVLRESNDKIYSAVICTEKGWLDFIKAYPLSQKYKLPNFNKQVVIVTMNDMLHEDITGFKRSGERSFFVDFSDSGRRFKLGRASEGKQRVNISVLSIEWGCTIPHVGIRSGRKNGLSIRYD